MRNTINAARLNGLMLKFRNKEIGKVALVRSFPGKRFPALEKVWNRNNRLGRNAAPLATSGLVHAKAAAGATVIERGVREIQVRVGDILTINSSN